MKSCTKLLKHNNNNIGGQKSKTTKKIKKSIIETKITNKKHKLDHKGIKLKRHPQS
jgi:hypothetical protein